MTMKIFNRKMAGAVLKGCAVLGVVLGGFLSPAGTEEVLAAGEPSIVDLRVTASGNGVSAECEFTGYDSDSGYTMELYLNVVNPDQSVGTVSGKDMPAAAADGGAGTISTEGCHVESGIYKVTLALQKDDGVNPPEIQFRNSALYDVVRQGDGYVISLYEESVQAPEDEGQDERMGSHDYGCRHDGITYDVVKEADAEHDALLAGKCGICGGILSYSDVPNTAYAAFLRGAAEAIQNAQPGEVTITTSRWVSFDRKVLEAIALRPDVSVTVNYRYGGKDYTVTVPAGADVSGLADENGFCGFRYLDGIFGGSALDK
ncbi:MAG: hypothetical protein K2G19_01830 [Lachnospiraceae bacterium]|nr:hypothetical protein [Lachnospiraceae bacterium]